jgi:hypothetical protein
MFGKAKPPPASSLAPALHLSIVVFTIAGYKFGTLAACNCCHYIMCIVEHNM